ncbi:uncharacterized protein E0L32_007379 [Thyridium curvatum]|uniref:WLM domain-containing protein n=1 Tax=Thyridium curvatum TaxID=1093900 RepID=A0A507B489_9PEZI|nr:uncharacterized protein E0L32_007379 [Thyridium curvatum]TPX11881.1 hypothetical protein E0L32_007379 [Thyridium curvatum]
MQDPTDTPPSEPQPQYDGHHPSSPDAAAEPLDRPISLTVTHAGQTRAFSFPSSATLEDLTLECEDAWGPEYDWSSHKLIAPPPAGLLKPADRPDEPLAPLLLGGKKLRLLATKLRDVDALRSAASLARRRDERRAAQRRDARRPQRSAPQTSRQDAAYTFLQIRPLPNLPNPQRSRAFLERLRDDPGIRAAMRAHRFAVGLLTEMDPLSYTQQSHEGTTRVLGLNRNKGEVIELRLRTDAYDGYRDYRTIRKTLCHELAHNVHGPHDRDFWDLCHAIEREVDRADWRHGGRSVGDAPVYDPEGSRDEEAEPLDHGGWTGGEYVLGGGPSSSSSASSRAGEGGEPPLSRREILAKAAEERIRRMNEDSPRSNGGRSEGSSSK